MRFWKAVVSSKDPSSFLVLFEDGAAVCGLLVVLALMTVNHKYNIPVLDGIASLIVGLILILVSLILARESRSLLMGEGIAPETQAKIKAIAERHPAVIGVGSILSTYQAPEQIVLMMIVYFKDELDTREINDAIEDIRHTVKKAFSLVEFVIIQPKASPEK
jgi:divalent metal cation (Fe/Co/Zn/Cd) transporter